MRVGEPDAVFSNIGGREVEEEGVVGVVYHETAACAQVLGCGVEHGDVGGVEDFKAVVAVPCPVLPDRGVVGVVQVQVGLCVVDEGVVHYGAVVRACGVGDAMGEVCNQAVGYRYVVVAGVEHAEIRKRRHGQCSEGYAVA